MSARVLCGGCQRDLGEQHDAGGRQQCPGCGSLVRVYAEQGCAVGKGFVFAAWKHKRPGYREFLAKGKTGHELSIKTGRMAEKVSVFDKETNRRYEHVTDAETGEVVHHCDHKLTEHRDHGSAKKNKKTR